MKYTGDHSNGIYCKRKVCEVRFFKGGMEYEYDIDAASGSILKFEKDYDD